MTSQIANCLEASWDGASEMFSEWFWRWYIYVLLKQVCEHKFTLWSLGELKMFLWTEDYLKEIGLEVKIHTQISAIDFYLRFLLLLLMTNRHNFNLAKTHLFYRCAWWTASEIQPEFYTALFIEPLLCVRRCTKHWGEDQTKLPVHLII